MKAIADPPQRACRAGTHSHRCRDWSSARLQAAARRRRLATELVIVLLLASVAAVWLSRLA